MSYFLWGCRGILTLITLRSERVNCKATFHVQASNGHSIKHGLYQARLNASERAVISISLKQRNAPCFHCLLTSSLSTLEHRYVKRHETKCWRLLYCSNPNYSETTTLRSAEHAKNEIYNGNRTEWSPIRSVIIGVITKFDDREAGVRFLNHEYEYRPTSDETKSHY